MLLKYSYLNNINHNLTDFDLLDFLVNQLKSSKSMNESCHDVFMSLANYSNLLNIDDFLNKRFKKILCDFRFLRDVHGHYYVTPYFKLYINKMSSPFTYIQEPLLHLKPLGEHSCRIINPLEVFSTKDANGNVLDSYDSVKCCIHNVCDLIVKLFPIITPTTLSNLYHLLFVFYTDWIDCHSYQSIIGSPHNGYPIFHDFLLFLRDLYVVNDVPWKDSYSDAFKISDVFEIIEAIGLTHCYKKLFDHHTSSKIYHTNNSMLLRTFHHKSCNQPVKSFRCNCRFTARSLIKFIISHNLYKNLSFNESVFLKNNLSHRLFIKN